jgi:hypothetical protein
MAINIPCAVFITDKNATCAIAKSSRFPGAAKLIQPPQIQNSAYYWIVYCHLSLYTFSYKTMMLF